MKNSQMKSSGGLCTENDSGEIEMENCIIGQ